MKKDKIIELRIDEEDPISGIDSISLVDEPAIEINWVAFNKEKAHEFHIPDGEDNKYLEMLIAKAEAEEDLLAEGYVIDHIELLDSKEVFATNPNANSEWDEPDFKVRYKYMLNPRITGQAAVIDTTRAFCKDLVNKNYVWRVEEMDNLRNEFGDSALVWRGGYNCRHIWGKMVYRKDATIVNKASINKGKVEVDGFPSGLNPELDIIGYPQPDTTTERTLNNPSPSTIRNLGLSKQKFEYPLFPTKEEAEYYAEEVLNCKGSHEHDVNGKTYYMPCEEHPEDMGYDVGTITGYVDPDIKKKKKKEDFESYTDYPLAASDNARRALKWAEKNGWGSCGTPVGKARANQLASRQAISEETISRMASFERHRQNKDVPYDEGCGGLMWDAWGGTAGIEWAQRKLRQIENAKFNNQKFEIQSEDKRIVVGPAMVPNLRIFRKDKKGNPYHVFFTDKTIRMIAEKYMRNKYIDNNDTNHDGKAVRDVYVIESWIKEDENDKSNKYGYDLPIGTWFVSMKVKDDNVWKKVKEGKLRGFSVSGYFEEIEQFAREEMFLSELAKLLKTIKE